jgi:hypothetical protein
MAKLSLTKQINILYILVAVLFALLLTGATMFIYFYVQKYISKDVHKSEAKGRNRCIVVTQNIPPASLPAKGTDRDLRVLQDPLYPALNRSEYDIHNNVVSAIDEKQLYQSSQKYNDRFRLVAYVTSTNSGSDEKDAGGNRWKLMGKTKSRNNADFFLVPVDKNYDMKLMLDNNIVVGEKLRDIYTIPKQLSFKSPLLHTTPYDVVELPMTDFTQPYY